jgi:predicted RecA/RadA family phage recombinase
VATNFRYSGKRLPVASASGTIASGAFCVQEGLFGVALTRAVTGASLWLGCEVVWEVELNDVNKGDAIYVAAMTDAVAATITKTPGFFVGTAISDHDPVTNKFLLLLGPQGPRTEA